LASPCCRHGRVAGGKLNDTKGVHYLRKLAPGPPSFAAMKTTSAFSSVS
jgi:hypothetical protein